MAYGAKIINWVAMVGHGETQEEALSSLKEHFNMYKKNNLDLPRPGIRVPLKFASTEMIDKYEEVAVDFFTKIFNINYYDGFYSDKSIFSYFVTFNNIPKETINQRVMDNYKIDITDFYDEPLWKVLQIVSDRVN